MEGLPWPSDGGHRGPTIQQQVLTHNKARMGRTQERASRAEFFAGAIAARRDRCLTLRARLLQGDALRLDDTAIEGRGTVCGVNAGQQVVDGHPLTRHLPRCARDIAGQAGARRVRQPQNRDRRLDGLRGDVDHPAPPALHHGRHQRLDQGDGGQHVGIQRFDEIVAVPIGPHTRRGAARIVDQNVDAAKILNCLGDKRINVLLFGQVALHREGFAARGLYFCHGGVCARAAGKVVDGDIRTLRREFLCRRAPDIAAASSDNRRLSRKFHMVSLLSDPTDGSRRLAGRAVAQHSGDQVLSCIRDAPQIRLHFWLKLVY
mmetsp:Transcript_7433/g.12541  ORF Transcript_7433/g.12541 Transcript_7433/m.12541 type:complete len:318 (-) Transcript_7433:1404-2357(-)